MTELTDSLCKLVDNNLRKVPPQNLEAESCVLGGILLENEAISQVLEILRPEDFYRESHRKIFRAMIELFDRREAIDLITLSEYLKGCGHIEAVGGTAYLASLAAMVPSVVNIAHYARIVKTKSQLCTIIRLCTTITDDAFTQGVDPLSLATKLSGELHALVGHTDNPFRQVSDVTAAVVKEIEKAASENRQIVGIPTGLKEIDEKLGGLHRQDLVIIAGRPSMGKTALGANLASNASERGYPACFVSAESPARKIVQRLLSAASRIENRDLLRGRVDGRINDVIGAASRIGQLPLWLLERERSWSRIQAKVRTLKLKEPALAVVVIDYIGLLSAPIARGERYLELGKISSEAKGLAIELNLAVVMLSQLNREVEARNDKQPRLSDLRESGNLEQDADIVGLLYRPSYYDPTFTPYDLAKLDIAKNRDGATGIIKLCFDEKTVSFSDWHEQGIIDVRKRAAGE